MVYVNKTLVLMLHHFDYEDADNTARNSDAAEKP